jgi:uncharacterized protein (TIGR03437 family)
MVCLCALACGTAVAQITPGTGYVFDLPGVKNPGFEFQGFLYNAAQISPVIDASGPASARQILTKPDGTKSYILGSGAGGLQSADPSFVNFRSVTGIVGVTCVAALTPDGKFLFVGAATSCASSSASTLYIIDTSTDSVLAHTVSVTAPIVGFAMSQDSKTVWMLTNVPFRAAVTAIDVATRKGTAQLSLDAGAAVSIAVSPAGFIYVACENVLFEINPAATVASQCGTNGGAPPLCVTTKGEIDNIQAIPGPLHFTPSGSYLYLVNTNPGNGPSLFQINLSTKAVASWPPPTGGNQPLFTDVYIAGENQIYALSAADSTIWDVTPTALAVAPSTTLATAIPVNSVLAVALSNELPTARYLYALLSQSPQNNLVRVDLSTKTITSRAVSNLPAGVLQFVSVPPQVGVGSFFPFNTTQTLTAGATSAPLTAIVLDTTGRPMNNVAVTYAPADAATNITINGATPLSNSNGFVTATATLPATATPSAYTVLLTAGTASQAYTLTIPGSNGNGGGNNGGPPQVTAVLGDGMLLQVNYPAPEPVTVLVTDTSGNPLADQTVTFTIASAGCGSSVMGPGTLLSATAMTDKFGMANTVFFPQSPMNGHTFQVTDVNATTAVGSVDFCETSYQTNIDGTGQPQIQLLTPGPDQNFTVSAGEGDTVKGAIQAQILASVYPDSNAPIPFVGIRIAAFGNPTLPGPATCAPGSSLSDPVHGIASCSIVASCKLQSTGMSAIVGENRFYNLDLTVGPGTGRKITIVSGDMQTGSTGASLTQVLVARVSDNCGTRVGGVPVTWAVTKGSATLKNTVNTSDAFGGISAGVVLGQTPGPVQVTASVAGSSVVFNVTSVAIVSGITLVSGGGQTVVVNQVLPQPAVFLVKDLSGNPVQNIQVTFAVVAGVASLNPSSALSDATGKVSTTITAGGTPGTVTISATYTTVSTTASETVTPIGPSINSMSFFNAATFGSPGAQMGLTPCGLGTLMGAGIADGVSGIVQGNPLGIPGPLPYTLKNFSMTIDNVDVPLLSISNVNGVQQVNFQTPCEISTATPATAVVTVNGNPTMIAGIPTFVAQPGLFNYAGPSNLPLGFIISTADGSYVTPNNPAKRGVTYYIVLSGLGQTTPPILTNSAGTGLQSVPLANVIVGLNNAGIPVTLAEYAPGQTGVYVVGFTIPVDAPTGPNQPLVVGVLVNGAAKFSNVVYVPQVN